MSRIAQTVPAESDVLCESCGYVLNGLDAASRCPECGELIQTSVGSDVRHPPAWEADGPRIGAFVATTLAVIISPTRFYRTLATRRGSGRSIQFARVQWTLCALLCALTAMVHYRTILSHWPEMWWAPVLAIVTYVAMWQVTRLAAKLSAWEGAYRGLRLPVDVVERGLHYHAAHYLPVVLIVLATVVTFNRMVATGHLELISPVTYLYILCGEVVVGAGYLFNTYWIGMRNMMYANQ